MSIYYHGSEQKNLLVIKPNVSTHGKKYIYAAKYRSIALLFLSRWNDFLLTLGTDYINNRLIITLVERYENAINNIYSDKSGVIYTIDSKNFRQEKDMWEFEYISEQNERPISCETINNILEEINILRKNGEIEIYYYPDRPSNIPKDDSDMVNKSIELYRLSGDKHNAIYCINRFPKLKEEIIRVFKDDFNIDLNKEEY
jgi:hypothetical protein